MTLVSNETHFHIILEAIHAAGIENTILRSFASTSENDFYFFALVSRQSAALSSVTEKEILPEFSFTLYPSLSRVGRENLMLRHSTPHFPPSSGGIAC